jgi:hypothetical protein
VPIFHRNADALRHQQLRDVLKQEMCQRRGVRLLVLPFDEPNPENWLRTRLET